MASTPQLRASAPSQPSSDCRRGSVVSGLPTTAMADPARRADPDTSVERRIETVGSVLSAEPPSGFTIRARQADHHTASVIFTRDDREGHGDPRDAPQHWWCHDLRRWMSWSQVLAYAARPRQRRVLEPLYASPPQPGCASDGAHRPGELCPLDWSAPHGHR